MESPFQGPGGGQSHMPHQPSYPGSQGLMMAPNSNMIPSEIQENQTEMDTSSAMSQILVREPQQHKELSMSIVCLMGNETVQDIVSKTSELFSLLKSVQPPNGNSLQNSAQEEKKQKLQDYLKTIHYSFAKLRRICERCNYGSATMEYTHIEVDSLVPLKDEPDSRQQDDRKPTDAYKTSSTEYNHLSERTFVRNKHLKEIIDRLRIFIWDINTMLAMRKQ